MSFEGTTKTIAQGDPPDTHGGVGTQYFLEVTNRFVAIYDKFGTTGLLKSATLGQFFNTNNDQLTDPRAVKDPLTLRWIMTAITFPQSDGKQYLHIMISQTEDARGWWWRFPPFDMAPHAGSGNISDFDNLGVDQNAALITVNTVNPQADQVVGSTLFAFNKAQLMTGNQSTFVSVHSGLAPLVAPPIVRDTNATTFFVAPVSRDIANGGATTLKLYAGQNLGTPSRTLSARPDVTVPAYAIPADAEQCAAANANELDSSDGRFVSAGTQVGNSLWQVHTTTVSLTNGRPRPRFYELNTATSTLNQTGQFSASATSDDFNASIVANNANYVFTNWNATEGNISPCSGVQVRLSGRAPGDPAGIIGAGSLIFQSVAGYCTSTTCPSEEPERWGDYSSVTIDPSTSSPLNCAIRAWLVNEKVNSPQVWGSRIAAGGHC